MPLARRYLKLKVERDRKFNLLATFCIWRLDFLKSNHRNIEANQKHLKDSSTHITSKTEILPNESFRSATHFVAKGNSSSARRMNPRLHGTRQGSLFDVKNRFVVALLHLRVGISHKDWQQAVQKKHQESEIMERIRVFKRKLIFDCMTCWSQRTEVCILSRLQADRLSRRADLRYVQRFMVGWTFIVDLRAQKQITQNSVLYAVNLRIKMFRKLCFFIWRSESFRLRQLYCVIGSHLQKTSLKLSRNVLLLCRAACADGNKLRWLRGKVQAEKDLRAVSKHFKKWDVLTYRTEILNSIQQRLGKKHDMKTKSFLYTFWCLWKKQKRSSGAKSARLFLRRQCSRLMIFFFGWKRLCIYGYTVRRKLIAMHVRRIHSIFLAILMDWSYLSKKRPLTHIKAGKMQAYTAVSNIRTVMSLWKFFVVKRRRWKSIINHMKSRRKGRQQLICLKSWFSYRQEITGLKSRSAHHQIRVSSEHLLKKIIFWQYTAKRLRIKKV